FKVQVDSVIIQNAQVVYREFPDKGLVPGELQFTGLNALFTPFQLTKEPDGYPVTASVLKAHALINDAAPISLEGQLFFSAPYSMELVAEVEEFDLALLNPIIETNAFVKVSDGVVRGGRWEFTLDNEVAKGNMALRYNDLKLVLLDERTLDRGRGRKNVLTFVINN